MPSHRRAANSLDRDMKNLPETRPSALRSTLRIFCAFAFTGTLLVSEDYSGAFGIAVTGIGSYSEKRDFGIGAEATVHFFVFNGSIETVKYFDEYKDRSLITSGYLGLGALNIAMLQGGIDNDGPTARLHGEIPISFKEGRISTELVYPRDRGGLVTFSPRDCLVVSYSFGIAKSGMFGGLGAGVVF